MIKPAFQPAPRPRPRTSPEEAQQLAAATGDLGFTRALTPPETRHEAPATEPLGTIAHTPKIPVAPTKSAALKFEVPDEVWIALRQEALNRRVTVKYLVLEALAAKGYNVDLSTVPEDGRRIR
jgi:hypothetical protein